MAELLKNMYNPQFIEKLSNELVEFLPDFDTKKFQDLIFDTDWDSRELKQRIRHIAIQLKPFLPDSYPDAVAILTKFALKIKIQKEGYFEYIFLCDFVEVFGLEDFENSIAAIEQITQLISAEFAVRPFILKYPEKMMQKMLQWSLHPQAAVRRLASEGMRPRLPWGIAIPALKKNPEPIMEILENLKTDESESVRRSVANNLNDISKDHPDLVLQIAAKWLGQNPETDWIIKHACRTLLKKGNTQALQHFGFEAITNTEIRNLKLNQAKIKIGDDLEFSFELIHQAPQNAKLRLEYGIDYVKANGKTSRKIFQIAENQYPPQQSIDFQRKQSFRDMTTRKHYVGKHCLAILVNGKEMANIEFELVAQDDEKANQN